MFRCGKGRVGCGGSPDFRNFQPRSGGCQGPNKGEHYSNFMRNQSLRTFVCCLAIVSFLQAGSGQNQSSDQAHVTPAMAEEKSKQSDKPDEIIRDAEILVFDHCSSVDVKVRPECGIEVVYTLSHDLKEGRIQVFDGLGLKIDAEYPLSDLAAGKHLTTLPKTFYWRGEDWEDSLPDSMLLFTLGISPVNQMVGTLWAESDESDSSPYDYKPEPCTKYESEICDEGAMFRGDEVGITSLYIPGNRNLKLRVSGELPELEILGLDLWKETKSSSEEASIPEDFSRPRCGTFVSFRQFLATQTAISQG